MPPTCHQPLVSPGHWNLVAFPPTRKATGIDPALERGGGRDGRTRRELDTVRCMRKGLSKWKKKWPNGSERPGKEERKGKKKKKEEFVLACAAFHPSHTRAYPPPPTPPSTLDLSPRTKKIACGNDIHDLIQNLAHTSFVHQKARQSKAGAQHQSSRKNKIKTTPCISHPEMRTTEMVSSFFRTVSEWMDPLHAADGRIGASHDLLGMGSNGDSQGPVL